MLGCNPTPQQRGSAHPPAQGRQRPRRPPLLQLSEARGGRWMPSPPPDLSGSTWGWPPIAKLSAGLPLGPLPFLTPPS